MNTPELPIIQAWNFAIKTLVCPVFSVINRHKQRFAALFLVVVLLFSASSPSVVLALAKSAQAAHAHKSVSPRAAKGIQLAGKGPHQPRHKTSAKPSIGKINYKSPPAPHTLRSSMLAAYDARSTHSAKGSGASLYGNKTSLLGLVHGDKSGGGMLPVSTAKPTFTPHEIVNARTATSSLYQNKNGSVTKTKYFAPHFYKNNGAWDTINTTLVPDHNAADSGNVFGKALGTVESWVKSPNSYQIKANSWDARFTPSNFTGGMVRIKQGNSQMGYAPVNANTVNPVITTANGQQTVHYYNLWNGVDVNYMVLSDEVKEAIVIKDKSAASQVQFKIVGANLQKPTAKSTPTSVQPAFNITGALNNQFSITPANLILNNFGYVDSKTSGLSQSYNNGTLTVGVNSSYLRSLPNKAFPAVIDPSVNSAFGTRAGGNYISFKSDGTICYSNTCDLYSGDLYDSNNILRYWQGAFYSSYNFLQTPGTTLNNADLHLTQLTGVSWWTGDTGTHGYQAAHATCLNAYNCFDSNTVTPETNIATSGDINVTSIYQNRIAAGDWGAWLMVLGQDGTYNSFKSFNPDYSYVTFTYTNSIPAPAILTPQAGQTYTDPQASFKLQTETNPNNSSVPMQYKMQVTSGADGTGGVVNSGDWQQSTNWTVPDGVLQNGSTYYVEAQSYDSSTGLSSPWSTPVPFRVNTRVGQNKSQTYDTFGPANVDLATGNLGTSIAGHSTTALGGSIGVNLDYNSPLKSRPGLVGSYWNTGGSGSASNPDLQRVDQNIDFNWNGDSPGAPINSTNFDAEWDGYFTAPTSGTYYFGFLTGGNASIFVNGHETISGDCHVSPICYDSGTALTSGQVVPFQVQYQQYTGSDFANVYVKGAVSEQIVPTTWLQTGVRQTQQPHGLLGKYYTYTDTGNPPTINSSSNTLFLTRTDPIINFNWDNSSPVSSGPTTDYLVEWTGFITLPQSGDYTFGTTGDDGSSLTINGQPIINYWQDGNSSNWGGSTFNAGTYPITVDYYQHVGGASMSLQVQPPNSTNAEVVPSSWLTPPQTQVLPAGWSLGLSPTGITYTHLYADQGNAILTDSSGDTYDYTWDSTTQGYKPPANSYGHLIRNDDGTFTLQASDGKTYVFDTSGNVVKVTSPVDDQDPAALRYTYGDVNGSGPYALQQITDGVNSNRYMKLYYSGASQCGTIPSGFYLAPPDMLCAAQTNDGRATYFYYDVNGNLAEVSGPGNEDTTYQYQSVSDVNNNVIGYQLTGVRDPLANDAVVAGDRTDDETTYTQMQYDALGRVVGVTEPQTTMGGYAQVAYTIDYYIGATEEHLVGATEPVGYSKRVEYDYMFRTTKVYNNQGLATSYVWDPVKDLLYSTTNPEGLMTTTIYDDEDRPVSQYGPAPASEFNIPSFTMPNNTTWTEGTSIWSPDGRFEFIFQTDGNVVEYGPDGAMWASNTGSQAATSLVMQTDGNLVEYNNGTPIWSSNTAGDGSATYLAVQNDGNVVLYNSSGPVWETNKGGWDPSPTQSSYGTPLSSYANSVARTDVSYDQGFTGLAVAYNQVEEPGTNDASLTGTPLLHGTNIATDGTMSHDWGSTPPVTTSNGDWGFSMTGTMRLPTTGIWAFQLGTDEGVRVWIDNQLFVNDWKDNKYWTGDITNYQPTVTDTLNYNNTVANSVHTIRIDYYHLNVSTDANFSLQLTPPGGSQTDQVATYFSPDYGLTTSATSYDSTYGNSTMNLNYGNNLSLGQVTSATIDPTGLNLTSSAAYETPGTGFLRQTSQTSPGGNSTSYSYYGANDTASNPCVSGSPAAYQAGMLKTVTNSSGETTTDVYDDAGNIVATQTNSDGWDCKTYDARGRLTQEVVPAYNGNPSRTVTYNYDINGDPLDTSVTSGYGTTEVETDILGRTYMYADANNDFTYEFYDSLGRVTETSGPQGNITYTYDNYNRLSKETVDGTDMADISYDQYGRLQSTVYPDAGNMQQTINYDINTGLENEIDYYFANNSTGIPDASDSTTFSQSGKITQDSVSASGSGITSNYTYDAAGRLTDASIVGGSTNNTYNYSYGAEDSSCPGGASTLPGNAGNRTSQTVNGTPTTYCYNTSDQLVSSSDPNYASATYDSHGNMTQFGDTTGGNGFQIQVGYDSSDRPTSMVQSDSSGDNWSMYYSRDASGRIMYREYDTYYTPSTYNSQGWYYGYSDSGNAPTVTMDSNFNVIEKYISLPGGVTLTIYPQNSDQASKYTYDLPNLHGDTFLTADGTGANQNNGSGPGGTYAYDPFGNAVFSDPYNIEGGNGSWGWEGSNKIATEDELSPQDPMVMGARIYLPGVGRFTSMDPIPGGNVNAYAYPLDPINFSDLTGLDGCFLQCTYNPQGGVAGTGFYQPAPSIRESGSIAGARIQAAAGYTFVYRQAAPRAHAFTGTPLGPLPAVSSMPISPASHPHASVGSVAPAAGGGFWSGVGADLHVAAHVAAAAAGGCVSSVAGFTAGAWIATAGSVAATGGTAFLIEVGVECAGGAAAGGAGYFIGPGADSPDSMAGDFRDGMSFGFYHGR